MDPRLETVLTAVWGDRAGEAKVSPLSGGITNQNFKIELPAGRFVIRLDGKGSAQLGIDRDREFSCAKTAASLGVGPDVVAGLPGAMVMRFLDGRALTPRAAAKPAVLKRIVSAVKRYHEGPVFPGRFSAFATVRDYLAKSRRAGVRFPASLPKVLRLMGRIEDTLGRPKALKPCHNDLLAGNFIDDGKAVRVLDWEYAAMGDPFFDLGNFAVNQDLDGEGDRLLLKEYFGEVRSGDLARLKLYRLASDLREAFWGFLQSAHSELEFDFRGYGKKHLDRFLSESLKALRT